MSDEKKTKSLDTDTTRLLERVEEQHPIVEHTGNYQKREKRTETLALIETKLRIVGANQ